MTCVKLELLSEVEAGLSRRDQERRDVVGTKRNVVSNDCKR